MDELDHLLVDIRDYDYDLVEFFPHVKGRSK